tara:strand:- start:5038 stop:5304 length:267 start_codon:yes stop_codon:yes gene_type:complete
MLKNILNFEGVSLLSKEEQKNVNGGLVALGGGCAARQWRSYAPPLTGEYYVVMHDLTADEAVAFANGGSGGGHVACSAAGYANSLWAS